jgi:Fe2+ transport system protein FeoA
VRLGSLRVGEVARIIDLPGSCESTNRLKSIGICGGRQIELVKAGDPVVVRVIGVRVGLSAHLASMVQVERLGSASTIAAHPISQYDVADSAP